MPLLFAILLLAVPGFAQTIYGLGIITGSNIRGAAVNSQGLVPINPTNGAALTLYPVAITGITAGQILVGMDFRPADNLLYALGYNGSIIGANAQLYLLNPATNAVSRVGAAIRLELGNATNRIGFDFNPVTDRIRVTSTNGANYRLAPTGALLATDGALAYAGGAPATPAISAVAYTNSFLGSRNTTLYDLDYRNGLLAVQSPPDAGTLTAPLPVTVVIPSGTYGIGEPDAMGLDIYYDPSTKENVGYLTEVTSLRSNGTRASNLYRLNLATGAATLLGNTVPASTFLNFEIRDVAVVLPQGVALPVELVRFTAKSEVPATVRLDWATASEQNSAYFAVERSLDGILFQAIGQVAALGNSFAVHDYGLTDAALPEGAALLYYRLRQVDRDGRVAYSPVQAVVPANKVARLALFPNPTKAATTLVGAAAGTTVQVLDALGRPVANATVDASGTANLALPAGLARGVYVVRTRSQVLRLLLN
ncbi:hypothetical protein GCM10027511_26670 [Hymenobacter humi]